MPESFNPNSPDAMFATILQRLNDQDDSRGSFRKDVLEKIDAVSSVASKTLTQATATNGRVTLLEADRNHIMELVKSFPVKSECKLHSTWLQENFKQLTKNDEAHNVIIQELNQRWKDEDERRQKQKSFYRGAAWIVGLIVTAAGAVLKFVDIK